MYPSPSKLKENIFPSFLLDLASLNQIDAGIFSLLMAHPTVNEFESTGDRMKGSRRKGERKRSIFTEWVF